MNLIKAVLAGSAALLVSAAPALAGNGQAQVPEPDTVALIAVASAGVLIGRRLAAKRPRD